MFEGDNLPEIAFFFVEFDQVMVVFVVSQAEAGIAEHAEGELIFQGADHEGFHGLLQPGIVVVVEVDFPLFNL